MARLLLFAMLFAGGVLAQDPFEIHVYEFEPLKPRQFTLEQHLNHWAMGSKQFDGMVAPTNNQLHITHELTGGITSEFALGFMQLDAVLPGAGLQYAGWRILPHFYAPRSWHAPLDLGLVIEFSFIRGQYASGTRHVEIRPILERRIGAFQLDFNPVFSRALHGPAIRDGWEFEPAARVAYGDIEKRRVVPYLEWYSELGSLPNFLPGVEQVHLLYFGADLKLARNLLWSPGLGVGLTSAEPRLVVKSRIEFTFGRAD